MKKLVILLLILCVGAGTYVLLKRPQPAPISITKETEISIAQPKVNNTESFIPRKLIIQKISVTASVEQVGLDSEKRMDVPKDDMNVGWYKLGPKPGDLGSTVMAGHFDTKEGDKAVFYRLSELEKGDSIVVESEDGKKREFVVSTTQIFKDETFPIDLVFSQKDKRRLNLITCDGVFDQNQKNYSDRLVVFSEMKEI